LMQAVLFLLTLLLPLHLLPPALLLGLPLRMLPSRLLLLPQRSSRLQRGAGIAWHIMV